MSGIFSSKYKIIKKLGEGVYGSVYLVQDKKDGNEFAVKKIYVDTLSVAELDILGKFDCPHLLSAKEIIYETEYAYAVLPLFPYDLSQVTFPNEDQKRTIMNQIAIGMETLHTQYYHCDLKPDNILISDKAVVADFSLAYSVNIPINKSVCAAVQYRPPEFILGTSDVLSALNDLWAYGCICYYIITGNNFIRSETDMPIYLKDPDTYLRRNITNEGYLTFLKKVLHPEQSQRYQSFTDILTDPLFSGYAKPKCIIKDTKKEFMLNFPMKKYLNIKEKMVPILTNWLLEVAAKFNVRAQTFIYAIDLMARTIPYDVKMADFQLYGIMCLYIAAELYEITGTIKLENVRILCNYQYSIEKIKDMYMNILSLAEPNIAQTTLYDYAKNLDQVKVIFNIIFGQEDDEMFKVTKEDLSKAPFKSDIFPYTEDYEIIKREFIRESVAYSPTDTYTIQFIFPYLK